MRCVAELNGKGAQVVLCQHAHSFETYGVHTARLVFLSLSFSVYVEKSPLTKLVIEFHVLASIMRAVNLLFVQTYISCMHFELEKKKWIFFFLSRCKFILINLFVSLLYATATIERVFNVNSYSTHARKCYPFLVFYIE